ncbi:MAG: rRNA pseudouridine synthase [Anaerolineales bacterium]|nr:rRNA pseudouridine synthase [Anaerolineales bacterium]
MERLQKVLAHAGVASRRKCEELILQGRVRVNGQVVTQLGTKVDPGQDTIEVDGRPITTEGKVYVLLHKPRGYLSDTLDFRGRLSALSLVPDGERLYPAGRLDAGSEGLLLLTNDGELAHHLTHPRYEHEKEYLALVVGKPTEATLRRMRKGVERDGQTLRADAVERLERLGPEARSHGWEKAPKGTAWLRITLHEGKKRHIRRMCAALGHPVRRLIRVRIGPLELGDLLVGEWRYLTEGEVKRLRSA